MISPKSIDHIENAIKELRLASDDLFSSDNRVMRFVSTELFNDIASLQDKQSIIIAAAEGRLS